MQKRLVLGLGLGFASLARCSGGDSTAIDGGTDATKDVIIEYYQAETAPPVGSLLDLAAGAHHTCAIVAYGLLQNATFCFGKDGALGGAKQGLWAIAATGAGTSPGLVQIVSGPEAGHTCAADAKNQVYCWGDDTAGQCGQGNITGNVAAPTAALDFNLGPAKASSIGIGKTTSCLVRHPDNKLVCFGDNTKCQGDLHEFDGVQNKEVCSASLAAAQVGTDEGVVFHNGSLVGLGSAHGCLYGAPITPGANGFFCWGDNTSMQSGPSGTITMPAVLGNIPPQKPISIAGGAAHTCYVTDPPHQLVCFGKNDQHQASPTSASATIAPAAAQPIALPQSAVPLTVATGPSETCAVDVTGQIWCFGATHGSNIDAVQGIKDVTKMAMGGGHYCAIGHLPADAASAPTSLLCWGDNTDGQAGQTAGTAVATPTAVILPATAPN